MVKVIVFSVSEQQNGWLLKVQLAFCVNDKVNRPLSKKMKKNVNMQNPCDCGWFFPTNDFSLLESCLLYVIAKYNASNCCKIGAVIQSGSVKKVSLKILKKSRCFPVNISKCLRTPVAASVEIRTKYLKLAKFSSSYF